MSAQGAIVSALMFWLLICLPYAECRQTLHAPETPTSCAVKQTDESISVTEFEFTGRVRAGEEYKCKFVPGFTFQLEPEADDWLIAVQEDKRNENLARFTPLVASRSPLLIAVASLLREDPKSGTQGQLEYEEHGYWPRFIQDHVGRNDPSPAW